MGKRNKKSRPLGVLVDDATVKTLPQMEFKGIPLRNLRETLNDARDIPIVVIGRGINM
jgi:uncharacterized protein